MSDSRGSQAYTILSTLHRSSRHIVYQAKNFFTGQPVIIKTPESHWKHDATVNSNLKQEADVCSRLDHPNIRKVQGVFEEDAVTYLVAEYIEGKPLYEIMGDLRNYPGTEQIVDWLEELLSALQYAHSQGVIHQCIDPSNVLIDKYGHAVFIGFGAGYTGTEHPKDGSNALHPLFFSAPEVFYHDSTDSRSDLYSLAVLAYTLLCQRLPWSLDTRLSPEKRKEQSLSRPILDPELLSRGIPRWLFTVLLKAMMPSPDDRFPDANAMLEAIKAEQVLHITTGRPYLPPSGKPQQPPALPTNTVEPAPETIAAKPVTPASKEKPSQQELGSERPNPKPAYQPSISGSSGTTAQRKPRDVEQNSLRRAWTSIMTDGQDATSDPVMARLRKNALIMGGISILMLLFLLGKYVIFPERPKLDILDEIEEEITPDVVQKVSNKQIRMVEVKGDSIVIGNTSAGADDDEFPTLRLKVPDFMMSPHEITNLQWSMVYPDFYYKNGDEDKPVVNVSFLEVLEYCNAKSAKDGLDPCYSVGNTYSCDFNANGYRLPTEAEWELAAKAGAHSKFTIYSGSDHADEVAWHKGNSENTLHQVGRKDKNAFGLFDMSGNAYEWVWNWYASYALSTNPYEGPATGTDRVIRGGSWTHDSREARVTNRAFQKPYARTTYVGFRLVRSK